MLTDIYSSVSIHCVEVKKMFRSQISLKNRTIFFLFNSSALMVKEERVETEQWFDLPHFIREREDYASVKTEGRSWEQRPSCFSLSRRVQLQLPQGSNTVFDK